MLFNRRRIGTALVAAHLAGFSSGAFAQNPDIVIEPPVLDYGSICTQSVRAPGSRISFDWTKWTGDRLDIDARETVSLARQYISGRGSVEKSPETALRMLRIALETYPEERRRLLFPLSDAINETATNTDQLKEAEQLLLEAFDLGVNRAAYRLGQLYGENGPLAMRDPAKSRRYYRLAALNSDVDGALEYASLVLDDPSSSEDVRRAAVQSALLGLIDRLRDGDCSAVNDIGFLYLDGTLVQQNTENALKWLEISAQNGDARIARRVASLYQSRPSGQINLEKSFTYLRVAADAGDATAQFNLGRAYMMGTGVEASSQQGEKYLLLAAGNRNNSANEWLARYYSGRLGHKAQKEKAREYFERALSGGTASDSLPLLYADFLLKSGDEGDFERGMALAREHAKNGNLSAGRFFAKNLIAQWPHQSAHHDEALSYLKMSARAADADSAKTLSDLYRCGKALPMSKADEEFWLREAAATASRYSSYRYGLYLAADSDPQRAEKGRTYLIQAAYTGLPDALGHVIARWEKGVDGFERNRMLADRLVMFVEQISDNREKQRAILSILENRFLFAADRDERIALINELETLTPSAEIYLSLADMMSIVYPDDTQKLIDVLNAAHELGDLRATRRLGKLYLDDLSLEAEVGLDLLRLASNSGDVKAQILLFDPTAPNALEELQILANSGEFCSFSERLSIARAFANIPNLDARPFAKAWLSHAEELASQDADDLYALARAFQSGVGGFEERHRAENYYLSALSAGRTNALRDLAEGHIDGLWTNSSLETAKGYLILLVELGNKNAANRLIGKISDGQIQSDISEVARLIDFLGQDARTSGGTLRKLARRNLRGDLGTIDPQLAFSWLTLSANAGDARSMFELYESYFFGINTQKDITQGLEWLEKAANADHPEAAKQLAIAYEVGLPGLEKNAEKANYWAEYARTLNALN